MRFSDAVKPALSREEAAMQQARTPTMSGGAAYNMIRMCQRENVETTQETTFYVQQKTAREAVQSAQTLNTQQCRAALRHVIRHSF